MMGRTAISSRQGFTLIELIAAMVLVGVAAAIAGVGFMSFTNIGSGKDAVKKTNLAQQRLELILAEKLKNGFPGTGPGPDPCELYTGLDDLCNPALTVTVIFSTNNNDDCNTDSPSFDYCNVKVTVDGRDYYMRLYNY